MADVVLDRINKVYANGFHAIRDLDLEVADGEFLILVGPSGCGKSTALRMIAGLEDITGGDLRIGGTRVVDIAPKDRDIAMVFQNYALYPNMSVYDNIGFSMKLARVNRTERDRRVREVAKVLQLGSMLDSRPSQLSGGQRQRVAMGRAMVREPAAFLMDEPLSNLDAKLRVQMRAEIARLQRSLGITTIYVTHDQIEAMTMGDRVAVLKGGVLQQVDTPSNLYHRPVNAFVAGFIGSPSMNLFEGRLAGERLVLDGVAVDLPGRVFSRVPRLAEYVGETVIVGIRPEDIADAGAGSAGVESRGAGSGSGSGETRSERATNGVGGRGDGGAPRISARVTAIEELGAERVAHLKIDARRVDSGDPDTIEDLGGESNAVGRFAPDSAARAGSDIFVSIDIDKMHFFDPTSHVALASAV